MALLPAAWLLLAALPHFSENHLACIGSGGFTTLNKCF
jgi:hypothetical protein